MLRPYSKWGAVIQNFGYIIRAVANRAQRKVKVVNIKVHRKVVNIKFTLCSRLVDLITSYIDRN